MKKKEKKKQRSIDYSMYILKKKIDMFLIVIVRSTCRYIFIDWNLIKIDNKSLSRPGFNYICKIIFLQKDIHLIFLRADLNEIWNSGKIFFSINNSLLTCESLKRYIQQMYELYPSKVNRPLIYLNLLI